MVGRQIFSEYEKLCLQELIVKYKLNLASTIGAGNPALKKMAWARLVEEYNSIESNCKRTEAQLKKCWDNLKTRKKALLAQEKKERMRTGGGCYHPKPGTSREDPSLIDEALTEQTDVEIQNVVDSDSLPKDLYEETLHLPASQIIVEISEPASSMLVPDSEAIPDSEKENAHRSGSRHTDYSASGQTPGRAKNIRARVINDEFLLRKDNYARIKEREEEAHNLLLEERRWLVKAAEEKYIKSQIKRQSAEEVLRLNQLRRKQLERHNLE